MATNSSNIKAYYGRMVEGINVFPSVKLTSESIKEFLADYSNLHMTLHMFRSSLGGDFEIQMTRIHKFLDKYNLGFNPEIELLTTRNEQLEYYQRETSEFVPIAFLSVPNFNTNEKGILYLENGVLIIGDRLIPEGFKFTFDKTMEEELLKLPTAKVGNIECKEIDSDMYDLSDEIAEGNVKELAELYNQLGYSEIASYLEEKQEKCSEGEEDYVFDNDYPYIRSCTFELKEEDIKYDYYFSKSIDFKCYRSEPYSEQDLYDCYFIKWINIAEKCAFLNVETGMFGDFEVSEANDYEIFDSTHTKTKTYNEFLDMIIMVNDITTK